MNNKLFLLSMTVFLPDQKSVLYITRQITVHLHVVDMHVLFPFFLITQRQCSFPLGGEYNVGVGSKGTNSGHYILTCR